MGCQTSYSCPITIPSGAAGAAGAAGTNGTDGIAILKNSVGTDYASTGIGNQTLTSYTLGAGVPSAGDIVVVEALFYLSTSFVGRIATTFGTTTDELAAYVVASGAVAPINANAVVPVKLIGRIQFVSAASQRVETEVISHGNPATITFDALTTFTVDTASASILYVRTNPSAGTATCKYLNVIHYKKV